MGLVPPLQILSPSPMGSLVRTPTDQSVHTEDLHDDNGKSNNNNNEETHFESV